MAERFSDSCVVSGSWCIGKWLLCLARASAFDTKPRKCAFGAGNTSSPSKNAGDLRLQRDLADYAVFAGIDRIRRIRRKLGLRCKQKRKFKATTNSKHTLPIAPNLLARDFTVPAPNRAWVSDITYIPTAEGWLYLAGIIDPAL